MRILFSAAYSAIEPLGLLHLAGLARDMGWERKIALADGRNWSRVTQAIRDFKPDFVGFNIYTGNHLQTFGYIKWLKKEHPNIKVIVGGPHATYFPMTAAKVADYVVMSEGFHSLQMILSGAVGEGVLPFNKSMRFPHPDRATLYADYPEFAASPIKSIIGMTGCPYRCTYCYNSSSVSDIQVSPELAQEIGENLGMSGRLFPFNVRDIEDIITEGAEIVDCWPETKIVYFQDDVHGFDTKEWLPELAHKWNDYVGLPYHAQMRWEMVAGEGGARRLDLVKGAGCTGLTLAIEAANPVIRKEVLDRATKHSVMVDGMKQIKERGLKVRTEQILALPYGATSVYTPVNLEADLEVVKLNCELKPDMSWASTFAPYAGTKLGKYADKHGYYQEPDNFDVPDTFFDRSILRFPREWTGPSLNADSDAWLEGDELELYRDQNAALRRHFNLLCRLDDGDQIALKFLTQTDRSVEALCEIIGGDYFDHLPFPELARARFKRYQESGRKDVLSTAVRHHLYEELLYK